MAPNVRLKRPCSASDDPQRHRANGRKKNAGRTANQNLCAYHGPELRKQRVSGQCGDSRAHQRTLRSEKVNQTASRSLRETARDSADGERETHALFVPTVVGKVNREEWSRTSASRKLSQSSRAAFLAKDA
jgi:hypothetical protein